jgi:hypothetical protein
MAIVVVEFLIRHLLNNQIKIVYTIALLSPMKTFLLAIIFVSLISRISVFGQFISSVVEIVTTYSQNEIFYLKSTPYDNESPTTRGKTSVYKKGDAKPLYEFERGFDSVDDDSNNLILSNNGEVIFHLISYGAKEEKEGLKSITIYKNGQLFKSYTESEITGCDEKKERCSLLYSNYDDVVDKEKSKFGTRNYKKVFKTGINEKERFLSDFPLFNSDDVVYLTDSKKKTHIFDLKTGNHIRSDSFENVIAEIKAKGRFNKTELQRFESPTFLDFPKLRDGKNTVESLASFIGMKTVETKGTKDDQFKQYRFKINATIARDGSLEIEEIESYDGLPKEKLIEFFKTNKFDSNLIPKEFEKWNIGDEYFVFRKKDDKLARQEKQQEIIENRKELERRLTAEKINDVYIPKDLGEALIELDKSLTEINKKEMQALPKRADMIQYHHSLGTWMRNNWGLWGGSRLQKYFTDKGIMHPDDMSSVVLFFYYDWLHGKKETWKDWDKNPKSVFQD